MVARRFGSLSAVKSDTEFDGKLWVERTLEGAKGIGLRIHQGAYRLMQVSSQAPSIPNSCNAFCG